MSRDKTSENSVKMAKVERNNFFFGDYNEIWTQFRVKFSLIYGFDAKCGWKM